MLVRMPVSLACMKVSSGRWRVILIRSHLVGRCSVSGGRPADKEIFVQTSLVLSPTISTALHQTCMRERRLVRTEHIACLHRLRTVISPNPVCKPTGEKSFHLIKLLWDNISCLMMQSMQCNYARSKWSRSDDCVSISHLSHLPSRVL